jgi:hypothetical protein
MEQYMMTMPCHGLLGVPTDYTREDIIIAFRRAAKKAHRSRWNRRDVSCPCRSSRSLLAALGTGAPAPKPPTYAPKGMHVIYRRESTGSHQPPPRWLDHASPRISVINMRIDGRKALVDRDAATTSAVGAFQQIKNAHG